MIAFIDAHRDRFGVEPICRVLTEHGVQDRPVAPTTRPRPGRRRRGRCATRELVELIGGCTPTATKGRGVCGVRKVWHLLAAGRASPVRPLHRSSG